jgi:hypothetical protein
MVPRAQNQPERWAKQEWPFGFRLIDIGIFPFVSAVLEVTVSK